MGETMMTAPAIPRPPEPDSKDTTREVEMAEIIEFRPAKTTDQAE
jgi:hypothetical protein